MSTVCWNSCLFLLTVAHICGVYSKVDIRRLNVPEYVVRGRDVRLTCQYSSDGGTLYVVRWYKDNNEFYRYVPRHEPPQKTFPQNAFTVDLSRSDAGTVQLQSISPEGSGTYTCEVITESPEFYTDYRRENMTVVELPEKRPQISNGPTHLRPSDWFNASCKSGPAIPAPVLTWYINGELVPPRNTRLHVQVLSKYLRVSQLYLTTQLRPSLFVGGVMRIKCTAAVGDIYWQSSETLFTMKRYNSRLKSSQSGPIALSISVLSLSFALNWYMA